MWKTKNKECIIKRKTIDPGSRKEKQDVHIYIVREQQEMWQIFREGFIFREDNPSGNKKKNILEKRIICEESKFNK